MLNYNYNYNHNHNYNFNQSSQTPNSPSNKIIHVIPAHQPTTPQTKSHQKPKKRVAAYARVSTGRDEQLTSLKSQIEHYEKEIRAHKDWAFAGIYSDEGLSGLTTKRREGFNQMITDAKNHKIDLILTKSISRFARNTLDTLTIIRELKEQNIEIYFEKENIFTLDSKGELLITIMSSLAQEESRSISENITWGIRRNMARGKVSLPYSHFLGYEKGPGGTPIINEPEAKIVRRIFKDFLSGLSFREIARRLEKDHIPTPAKLKTWSASTIASILRNEKYKGDALLQKVYTADYLNKTLKPNTGEIPQYYVEHSHPAIISREIYEKAQTELKLRAGSCGHGQVSPFQGLIFCGTCGARYRRYVRYAYKNHSNYSWKCSRHPACANPSIHEETLMLKLQPQSRPDFTAKIARVIIQPDASLQIAQSDI